MVKRARSKEQSSRNYDKRPVKKRNSPRYPSARNKKEYKPLFEKGDAIYAPWWENGDRSKQQWHPGVILNYTTEKDGPYGPIRRYSVQFDDGDKLDDVEDYSILSWEDFQLESKNEERGGEWVGVLERFDKRSTDEWAKSVGWYEVNIGEFALISFRLFCMTLLNTDQSRFSCA